MRQFQVIVHYLAFSIVLLHSFIPHRHHSELRAEEHQIEHKEASTVIDLLTLAFHNNHQYEEYTSADDTSGNEELEVNHAIPTLLSNTAISFIELEEEAPLAELPVTIPKRAVLTYALRGPPTIS